MRELWRRLGRRFHPQTAWHEEIHSHLTLRREWNRAQGLSPGEAHRAARRQFGPSLRTLEEIRAAHTRAWLDNLLGDTKNAMRGFRRSPVFFLIAISTLAIGVGASTAVFSVIDPLLFRSLPYPRDEQLVSVGYFGPIDTNEFNVVSSYLEWRRLQTPFQMLTSMRPASTCDLVAGGTPQQVACYGVEANFLRTFGITPDLGRDFAPQDDLPRAPTVILISHRLWQQVFGGDAQILGRTVTVNEEPVRIIGVLPQRFEMPQLGDWDVLLPERLDASLPHSVNSNSALRTFARLREGVSIADARDQMRPLFEAGLREDVPAALRVEVRLMVRSLRERQIHEVKLASWMLLGAALALLLIACANIANLLLARAAARRRELAVRAAIGAGRGRLIRQMLTESLLLGLAGCVGGCGLGWVFLGALVRLAPDGLVRLGLAAIQLRVLLFALGTSLAAALLFGILPALEQPRAESLIGWRAAAAAPMALRRCLVAAQAAISLVLLTGASLFLRSLWKLETQPLGFRPERLLTASLTLRRQRYQAAAAQVAFFQQLETRLKTIPGGGAFALSDSIPPRGSMGRPYSNMRIAGHPPLAQKGGLVAFRWVTPGYFQALGIAMVTGRDFENAERAAGEPPLILSASLAHRMFGNENPIGQHIELDSDGRWSEVVGVAADAKNSGIDVIADPEYYRLRMNDGPGFGGTAVALFRTSLDEATLARWVRRELAAVDPGIPVKVERMEARVGRFTDRPRFLASLVAVFAAIGLVLAAVGVYGVLSLLVAQQTREIGVRMALGARPRDIAWRIQGYAGSWTGIGVAAGLILSSVLTRLVRGLLFDVSPADPSSLTSAAGVLAILAALAAWVPARRAARVDPVVALREE